MCLANRQIGYSSVFSALLPWCSSLCLFVWDGHALWSYGATSADFSSWLDSPMFWAPLHQSMSTYSQLSFSSSTWKRCGVWKCTLWVIYQERLKVEAKLLVSAIESHICRIDWHNNGWPWMTSYRIARYLSAVAELLVESALSVVYSVVFYRIAHHPLIIASGRHYTQTWQTTHVNDEYWLLFVILRRDRRSWKRGICYGKCIALSVLPLPGICSAGKG